MTRLKVAELTSGVGALVLGVGLGALFARWFAPGAGVIALAGVVAHAFGMWDKHRLEGQTHPPSGLWVTALYWACWLLLAGVVAFVFVAR
jgi:membrane-bound ClpP family serine protease